MSNAKPMRNRARLSIYLRQNGDEWRLTSRQRRRLAHKGNREEAQLSRKAAA